MAISEAADATPAVKTVGVALGPLSYDIKVGRGLLATAGDAIAALRPAVTAGTARCFIVADADVALHYLAPLQASLGNAKVAHVALTVPAGEGSKCFAQLETLLDELLGHRIERGDLVVALGGGVAGDLAGFAAAVVLRGIDFVQVPTTLLAQVDSAVGGKTGINTARGKNLVGAFHQPKLVLADVDTLASLPARQVRAGYAEVVKYGLLGDAGFFAWLEQHGQAVLDGDADARIAAVARSCVMKAEIVAEDAREHGRRALLNLGHTFGHALEAEAGYSDGALLHGEAVAWGMGLAFDLSARLGHCTAAEAARVRRHLAAVGLVSATPGLPQIGVEWDAAALVDRMAGDKKVKGGRPTFVLARSIGDGFTTQDVPREAVEDLLRDAAASGDT